MGQPFQYLAGGPFQGPNDMIVDDLFAEQNHTKVGDHYDVLNQSFRVCGIVEHGKGARRYVPITTLQDLLGSEGKASMFFVKTDTPDNAETVVAEIKQIPGMEQYVARSLAEYASLMTVANMPGLGPFIDIVIGISVIIGFIVIFQSMYTAVMERTREIGILKSLGATRFYIVNVVLRESFLLAVGGVLLGLVFTGLGSAAINYKFPLQPRDVGRSLGGARRHHRHRGRIARRPVSGAEGGTERSHRSAGLRVESRTSALMKAAPDAIQGSFHLWSWRGVRFGDFREATADGGAY